MNALFVGVTLPDQCIVVDNNPTPLVMNDSRVLCVRPDKNKGYLAGLRYGVHKSVESPASILVLMNNDIVFEQDFLKNITQWWQHNGNNHTLAGPRAGTLSPLSGRAYAHRARVLFPLQYIDGACMVISRSFFDSISGFEQLFMYWEDVAMSLEARKQLGTLKIIPDLRLQHASDSIRDVSEEKLYYLVRNGAFVLQRLPAFCGAYWYIVNIVRLWIHNALPGARHALMARALHDARYLL